MIKDWRSDELRKYVRAQIWARLEGHFAYLAIRAVAFSTTFRRHARTNKNVWLGKPLLIEPPAAPQPKRLRAAA
jgi:hypothetical protein